MAWCLVKAQGQLYFTSTVKYKHTYITIQHTANIVEKIFPVTKMTHCKLETWIEIKTFPKDGKSVGYCLANWLFFGTSCKV